MNDNGESERNPRKPLETPQQRRGPDESHSRGTGPRLMTANALNGTKIINRQDETLGTISDIMLDVEHGGIAYAVMAAGGFMGVGERLFALPWYALTLDNERHCCVLNADKATFEDAPGFDKNHWPESPFQN